MLNSEISQSKQKLIELLQQINSLNKFKTSLHTSNRNLTQKYTDLSKQYADLKTDVASLENRRELLREEIKK